MSRIKVDVEVAMLLALCKLLNQDSKLSMDSQLRSFLHNKFFLVIIWLKDALEDGQQLLATISKMHIWSKKLALHMSQAVVKIRCHRVNCIKNASQSQEPRMHKNWETSMRKELCKKFIWMGLLLSVGILLQVFHLTEEEFLPQWNLLKELLLLN